MKLSYLSIILMLLTSHISLAATLTIHIRGVRNSEGDMRASLCDSEARYKKDDCKRDIVVPAVKGTTTIKFDNVPPGRYAFTILHDKNNNGKMDSNFLNIPREGFAFSNNTRPAFSEPPFNKVAFDVSNSDVTQNIDLIFY